MKKNILFPLLTTVLLLCVAGCIEDTPLSNPKIEINDNTNIKVDAAILDLLQIPVAITSEDFLYSVKIFTLDNKGNEHVLRNYFFDTPINKLEDTCYYQDFLKAEMPAINLLTSFGVTAKTNRGVTRTVNSVFIFSNFASPLSEEGSFSWKRVGANKGEGLSQFGLVWENDTIEETARITLEKAEKMVELHAEQWMSIVEKKQLVNAVNMAPAVDVCNKVSVLFSAKYDIVLGVVVNTKYYMLRITQSDVSETETEKTVIISGLYKESLL